MDFDFIGSEDFRMSLTNDFREITACLDAKSWKAVHVLAGSMVEALLVEYLVVSRPGPTTTKDPHKMDLSEAIAACRDECVISATTASLCDVIRGYRNLIHPGRLIRLKEEVTPEGAQIAASLVRLISKEIAKGRKLNYGLTAEQIVRKVRSDEHCLVVLPELLSDTKEHERVRLVTSVIPDAYRTDDAFLPDADVLKRLRASFRLTLDTLPSLEQKKISDRFALSVREDSFERIQLYSDAFFASADIGHLSEKDAAIVLKHLLNRLDQPAVNAEFLQTVEGIGNWIKKDRMIAFSDSLIKLLLRHPPDTQSFVQTYVYREYDRITNSELTEIMERRLERWVSGPLTKPLASEALARLKALNVQWSDIPF